MLFLRRWSTRVLVASALVWAAPFSSVQQVSAAQQAATATNPDASSYTTPPDAVRRILETDRNYATLNYQSPDGDHFLVPRINELSTMELMSKETYRLAELEVRPQTNRLWHLDTYGIYDFSFY